MQSGCKPALLLAPNGPLSDFDHSLIPGCALIEALPDGARVGTVDKFQGQEAPIVIYSMTSFSAEDAPRGMDFLYSANRLNVATSRAMCLVGGEGTAALFGPECKSPKQMRLANAFCRLKEMIGGEGAR